MLAVHARIELASPDRQSGRITTTPMDQMSVTHVTIAFSLVDPMRIELITISLQGSSASLGTCEPKIEAVVAQLLKRDNFRPVNLALPYLSPVQSRTIYRIFLA